MILEFYVSPEGELRVVDKDKRSDNPLRGQKKLVDELALQIVEHFPEAFAECVKIAQETRPQSTSEDWKTLAIERFVRCNFGERDIMPDWNDGFWELEEVKCPLRGICKKENVICHPSHRDLNSQEEKSVALMALGYEAKHISQKMNICYRSMRDIILKVKTKLGIEDNSKLRRIFKGIHLERRSRTLLY